jgi:hypothetical protein
MHSVSQHQKRQFMAFFSIRINWFLLAIAALVAGCGKQEAGTELGKGGSIVTGSAGPAGTKNAARELVTCDAPVAVVSLVENRGGYVGIGRGGLPESPLPLVRVLMQQSGCFRIVDRNSGLEQTINEQALKEKGVLRSDEVGDVKKGRGIVAQYSVVPSLTFSEADAGRNIGGVLSAVGLDKVAGLAAQVKFKEAQVVLLPQNSCHPPQALPAPQTWGLAAWRLAKLVVPGDLDGATQMRAKLSLPRFWMPITTW